MPQRRRKNVVQDSEQDSTAEPTIREILPERPKDYDLLELWTVNSFSNNPSTAVNFVNEQPYQLPINLYDNNWVENNETLVLRISPGESFGFTQAEYTFRESNDIVFVGVSPTSNIHQVTITINDNDRIDQTRNGDAANNSLSGTSSNDALYGLGGNDTLNGGNGNDRLYGGDGSSNLNDGNDSLKGEEGDDTLDGGAGSDTMYGGTGNDVYIVNDSGDTVIEYQNQGLDTVRSSVTFSFELPGRDRLDNLTLTGSSQINGTGNALNNKIIGNFSNNLLFGRDGNDTLFGDAGNDTFFGENGDDSLYGGFGNDTLLGGSGNDYLNGAQGNDTLDGGEGDDILDGWEDNDLLEGEAGNDTLAGDLGNDTLNGGDGNDELYGEEDDDSLYGGLGNDKLYGDSGNDSLDGGAGNNTLEGGEGNDTLLGGVGNDSLVGGDGNDRLNGYGTTVTNDSQIDTLNGEAGIDYFILGGTWGVSYVETGDGYAIITNWDSTSDWIEVRGSSSQYSLEFSRNVVGSSAIDTEIYYTGGGGKERIGVVQDTTNVSISMDFHFV